MGSEGRPHLDTRRFLGAAVWLAMILAGCSMVPPPQPPAVGSMAGTAKISIADEQGRLGPKRAAAAVRQLERDGEDGLLTLHLRQVEDVIAQPLTLGNEARLLIDGPQTQDAMLRAVSEARHSIDVETYILEPSGIGERLAAAFETKRAEGVTIRVVYDSIGSLATPAAYFDRLRAIGVSVCEFNPVNPLRAQHEERLGVNNRDHRKLLIVDGQVAFTGGINISNVYSSSSFGKSRKAPDRESGWRDTHVVVRGPVVSQFSALFNETWRTQGCSQAGGEHRAGPEPERVGKMAVRLVAADPASPRSELYLALLSAIEHARDRIWLTYGYFVPDENVLRALQEAAQRGVDVRLILPGFSDFWAPFHAGRSHYSALLNAGARVFERRDALLHAKTAVIDSVWCSVGSTNLDWRSFVHNYEADLLVLDRRFAGEMQALFRLDEKASYPITASDWQQRGLHLRLLEWLARRWEYFL